MRLAATEAQYGRQDQASTQLHHTSGEVHVDLPLPYEVLVDANSEVIPMTMVWLVRASLRLPFAIQSS